MNFQPNLAKQTDLAKRPDDFDDDSINLAEMVGTLWRGKWLIVLVAALFTVAAGNYAYRVAIPSYQARTQMVLIFDQSPLIDIASAVTGVSSDNPSINTQMEIIRSRELVARLVDELDLTKDPEFNPALLPPSRFSREQVVAWVKNLMGISTPEAEVQTDEQVRNGTILRVQSAISTSIGRDTYVFTISATTQSQAKSALITNTLARIYQEDQIAIKIEGTQNAVIWLSERVAELEPELEQKQVEINERRSSNSLVSPEAIAAINAQSVELTGQIASAELDLERAQEALEILTSAVGQEVSVRAQAAQDAADLTTVNMRSNARASFGDAQLQDLAEAAAAGDPASLSRFDRRFELLLLQKTAERDELAQAISDLRTQSDRLASQFESQAEELIAIQQLERERDATRVLYETFLNRLRETSVQIGVQEADSRVISEATGGRLVAPQKTRIVALGLILGLMTAAAALLLREAMQNTFRTAKQLEEQTGDSVLGQIPKIPARGRIGTIEYLTKKPTSAAAEAIRNLRTSVLMSNVDTDAQVIMATSSIPAEGKTTTTIALAQNLAGLNKTVLLIEGDIRRRTFGAYFPEATAKPGILSLVSNYGKHGADEGAPDTSNAIYSNPSLGIDILMGEKSSVNAADVFASDAFQKMMEDLRARYDYIIIDTPPVLVVPDARVIGQLVDAIIYVVNWDSTSHSQVAEGLRQLSSVNLGVTGMVLTKIDPRGMRRYGYGDGYGAYSRYGKGYYDS